MPKLRLFDVRHSRLPEAVGLCKSDIAEVANITNSAERQLLLARESGDTGWFGSWGRMVFNVDQQHPSITVPFGIARLIAMDVCQRPIVIQNEFYEFLEFGNGLMPRGACTGCSPQQFLQTYSRGEVPTFRDIDPNQFVRVIATDNTDYGQRVLLQGLDANGSKIISEDVLNQVQGIYIVLDTPFVQSPMIISKITGVQKDFTSGPVIIQQADAVTGATVTLLTMDPAETVAGYQRYFINGVPINCCAGTGTPGNVQVTCMVKFDHIDVANDQDYYVLHNLEALIAQCQAIRYSEMDTQAAMSKSKDRHKEAISLLQGELVHYLGKYRPAVEFAPFGSAHLSRQRIGNLI